MTGLDPDEERAREKERLCRAFRTAYEQAGLTQEALSVATGVRQATLSKYARGETAPPLWVLERVDQACGQPLGHVLRLAGYVDDDLDTTGAVLVDPDIDAEQRRLVLRVYEQFRKLSASA